MIPLWKLKREAVRLGLQLRRIPEAFTDPLARRKLDALLQQGLPEHAGALQESSRIALFLVFQPAGLKQSTIETCAWLAAHGYAPFVVSNAPLSKADLSRLGAVTWKSIERPNFGYDFGGYRDGLACLRSWGVHPETLLILNDSIWLPTLLHSDLLARLEDKSADIAGAILRVTERRRFLESYLFRIRLPVLRHEAFISYWRNLKLSSNKLSVIKRGEHGFSKAMLEAGFRIDAIYDANSLADQIVDQPDEFLRKTLAYGAYIDSDLLAEKHRLLLQSGENWREDVLAHIRKTLIKRSGYSSFPFAMMRLQSYPILKKSNEPINRNWRIAYLSAIEDGVVPPPSAAMLDEIRCSSLTPPPTPPAPPHNPPPSAKSAPPAR